MEAVSPGSISNVMLEDIFLMIVFQKGAFDD